MTEPSPVPGASATTVPPAAAVAGVLAPPPVLYLGTLGLGGAAQWLYPIPWLAHALVPWLAGGLLLAGVLLARWSFVTLRRLGTSGNPRTPTQALAMEGPFRHSRNPIYLAMTLLYLGLATLLNASWLLLLLPSLLILMHCGVIEREEHYLTQRFGAAYERYRQQVRRWL